MNCAAPERCSGCWTSTTSSSSSCGPAPSGTRLLLSDATAALDYDIAAEALETLDADISPRTSRTPTRSKRAIWACLADIGLPEAVLGVILDETDLYADEQLGRIAREMGFAEELAAVSTALIGDS